MLGMLALLWALPGNAQAPQMVWSQRADVGSPGRYSRAAMAFDDRQGVMLLFGGDASPADGVLGFPTNDLWQYDGTAWIPVVVNGVKPAARSGHAMVYDPVAQRVLLFGGDAGGGSFLNDFWAFAFSGPAAGAWQRLADLPDAGRWGMSMAYDAGHDRVVIVGGIRQGTLPQDTPSGRYNAVPATRQTFFWNRTAWTAGPDSAEYNNGPFTDRAEHRVIGGPLNGTLGYHPVSGELILLAERLFPFQTTPVGNYARVGGVSLLEAAGWSQNTGGYVSVIGGLPPGYRAISNSRIQSAYDPVRERLVIATGEDSQSMEYTGRGWTDYSYNPSPGVFYDLGRGSFGNLPSRPGFCMAHDSKRGATVFFGGKGVGAEPGDTWELRGNPAVPFLITTNLERTLIEVCQGEGIALNGAVQTAGPVSVRWFRNNTAIAGQTNFTLVRGNLSSADSGEYQFVVTDSAGRRRTSEVTKVYVHMAPTFTAPPVPRRVAPGESFALEAGWSSSLPVTIQWFHGDVPIPGATGAVYEKLSAELADGGLYSVRLTTRCTTVASTPVRVMVGPVVLQDPVAAPDSSVGSSPIGMRVVGDGVGALDGVYRTTSGTVDHPNHLAPDDALKPRPLTFTWRREGVPIALGGRFSVSNTPLTSLLLIQEPDYEDEGAYDCVVGDITGPANAVASRQTVLVLRPLAPPFLTLQKGVGPDPRFNAGMVQDTRRHRTVLFGGTAQGMDPRSTTPRVLQYASNDTWEWDGQVWVKRNPVNRPPPITDFGMVYDSRRGRVVLFGGYVFRPPNYSQGDAVLSNAVWEWDGNDWSQVTSLTPSPLARSQPSLCFDSVRGEVLMMGGYYFNPNPADQALERNSLWAWDGRQWNARAVLPRSGFNQPPEVYPGNQFCFDESRGVAVMFGPFFDSRQPVCEWNGVKWEVKYPADLKVLDSRGGGSAFYDPIRRLVGLPIVGNNLQPYVAPLAASLVFWDGVKFLRGDHITINDLTGTNLTNYFEAGPNLQQGDLTAYDPERRALVWLDMNQFFYTAPTTLREMHFSAKAKPVFQPVQVFFGTNQTVELRVVSAGQRPLFQQWFKDGAPILDEVRVTGAATATLRIPNATASDAGLYTLRVGNVYRQVMSEPIRLGVQPDGVAYVAQGSGLVLSWPGTTGILEVSPTPTGPWTPVFGATPPYSVAQDEGNGFYRVRYP